MAYCSAWGPTEILYAMDLVPFMPENYSVLAAARQQVLPFLEEAEARGISRDVCSYCRASLGMMWLEEGPYGPLPRPDLVISYPHLCDPYSGWWELHARHYEAPMFNFDGPFLLKAEPQKHHLEWVTRQLKDLVVFIERTTGRRFDQDRFREAVALSARAKALAWQLQEYRKSVPSPIGLREAVNDIFYLSVYLGRQEAVDYFDQACREAREKIEQGRGSIPREKIRLFFYNIPPWYCLGEFIRLFADREAVIVSDYYTGFLWLGDYFDGLTLDPDRPFESLARAHLYFSGVVGLDSDMERLVKAVTEWRCHGAIFNICPGCQVHSRNETLKMKKLNELTGLPVVGYEAAQADPRTYAEEKVRLIVESFLDTLDARHAQV